MKKKKLTQIHIICHPTTKRNLKVNLGRAGFGTLTDGIKALFRDFNAGRIKYRSGVLIKTA